MGKKTTRFRLAEESPVSQRQPKTDRLFLARLVKDEGEDNRLEAEPLREFHKVILKWADLESSGRLAELTETQLQGEFLAEVFGEVLGYQQATANEETWQLEQFRSVGEQKPDAVLGHFRQDTPSDPLAVIELKGPKWHLDRDRSNGRTAVDQCWDYLVNTPPSCRWDIVSNMVSFRLYERD